jgi:hypothetical protein
LHGYAPPFYALTRVLTTVDLASVYVFEGPA